MAKSTAPAVGVGSIPKRSGTSVTTTRTVRSTQGQNTGSATAQRPPAERQSPNGGSRESGEVAKAVERDLAIISRHAPELAQSALAASTLALAREIDEPTNSATSKSMCAKVLLETLDRLRGLIPTDQEADGLDDLAARRATRLAGGTTS